MARASGKEPLLKGHIDTAFVSGDVPDLNRDETSRRGCACDSNVDLKEGRRTMTSLGTTSPRSTMLPGMRGSVTRDSMIFPEGKSAITVRSVIIGGIFACVNSSTNMFFNFRYAGGLGQYWVIICAYMILWFLSHTLKPPTLFTIQEHALVMVCGAAAAFSQSLGLSGGLAPLTLYYDKPFDLGHLFLWTFTAGFYGVFLGVLFGHVLVWGDKLPWPIAEMNAQTIGAFHGQNNTESVRDTMTSLATEGEVNIDTEIEFETKKLAAHRAIVKSLKVFGVFAVPSLFWFVLTNGYLSFFINFPLLCWLCNKAKCQVLGEGFVGVGFPGLAVLSFWIISPSLYFSGEVIWPGGLNLFESNGDPFDSATGKGNGKIHVSSTLWLTMIGLCWMLIGQLVATLDEFAPKAITFFKNLQKRTDDSTSRRGSLWEITRMTMTADPGWSGHVPLALPLVVVFCLSATFVYVVHYLDIGLPVWGTCVTISVSLMMTLALGYLVGTSGQNLAINNAITSQSLTLFNDYRTAILLAVRPRDMLAMQLWGTFLGLICSVLVYDLIMTMEQQGKIHFNKGVWANLGASGAHLNGEVFGTFGLGTILSENPSLKAFTIFLFITGIISPLVRRRLPDRIRPYFPDTVLIGVSQFVSSTSFSCMSALIVALFYQHYLRYRHTSWYKKYQMVSTSGMNMGVGIGGIVLLILTSLNWTHKVDIGGPAGDGCHFTPTNMPQF